MRGAGGDPLGGYGADSVCQLLQAGTHVTTSPVLVPVGNASSAYTANQAVLDNLL